MKLTNTAGIDTKDFILQAIEEAVTFPIKCKIPIDLGFVKTAVYITITKDNFETRYNTVFPIIESILTKLIGNLLVEV